MIIELPEDNLRFLISNENLVHLDDLVKNAYLVKTFYIKLFKLCLLYFIFIYYFL
jgi:hypothetical protein